MSLFWKLNYFISFYFLLVLLINITFDSLMFVENIIYKMFVILITFDNNLELFSFVNDFLQFIICVIVLIFIRSERIKKNIIYILLLFILTIIKMFGYIYIISGIYM